MSSTVLELLARRGSGIESSPDIAAGEPCVAGTRIPVWTLDQYRRLGSSEAQILMAFPGLRAADLVAAWTYVSEHADEIDRQIRDHEAD